MILSYNLLSSLLDVALTTQLSTTQLSTISLHSVTSMTPNSCSDVDKTMFDERLNEAYKTSTFTRSALTVSIVCSCKIYNIFYFLLRSNLFRNDIPTLIYRNREADGPPEPELGKTKVTSLSQDELSSESGTDSQTSINFQPVMEATLDSKADVLQTGSGDQQLNGEVPKMNDVATTSLKNVGTVSESYETRAQISPMSTDPPPSDVNTCLPKENDVSMKKMATPTEVNVSSGTSESSNISECVEIPINEEAAEIPQSNCVGKMSSTSSLDVSLETNASSITTSTIATNKTEIPVVVSSKITTDEESNASNSSATNCRTDCTTTDVLNHETCRDEIKHS